MNDFVFHQYFQVFVSPNGWLDTKKNWYNRVPSHTHPVGFLIAVAKAEMTKILNLY